MSSTVLWSVIILAGTLTAIATQASCRGRCGAEYYRGYMCQCDYQCLLHEECCKDFEFQCTTRDSCKGRCGESFKRGRQCNCDSDCVKYKQCCPDYQSHCDSDSTVNEQAEQGNLSPPAFVDDSPDTDFFPLATQPSDLTDVLNDDVYGQVYPNLPDDPVSDMGQEDPETTDGTEPTQTAPPEPAPTEHSTPDPLENPEFDEGTVTMAPQTEMTPTDSSDDNPTTTDPPPSPSDSIKDASPIESTGYGPESDPAMAAETGANSLDSSQPPTSEALPWPVSIDDGQQLENSGADPDMIIPELDNVGPSKPSPELSEVLIPTDTTEPSQANQAASETTPATRPTFGLDDSATIAPDFTGSTQASFSEPSSMPEGTDPSKMGEPTAIPEGTVPSEMGEPTAIPEGTVPSEMGEPTAIPEGTVPSEMGEPTAIPEGTVPSEMGEPTAIAEGTVPSEMGEPTAIPEGTVPSEMGEPTANPEGTVPNEMREPTANPEGTVPSEMGADATSNSLADALAATTMSSSDPKDPDAAGMDQAPGTDATPESGASSDSPAPQDDAITTLAPSPTDPAQDEITTVNPVPTKLSMSEPIEKTQTPKPNPSKPPTTKPSFNKPISKPTPKPVDAAQPLNIDDPRNYQADNRNDTDICSGRPVSAVTTLRNGTIVVFRGHYFWVLDRNRVPGPARSIMATWGIPSPIDTAFTRCNCQGKTYIFKGAKYWRFDNDAVDPGYPKAIAMGFDGLHGHITAALSVPQYRRRKEAVYFFKRGGSVQKYSYQFGTSPTCGRRVQYSTYIDRTRLARQAVSNLEPAINIRVSWRGFPTMITSAVSAPSRWVPEGYKYYVFSRSKYYSVRMDGGRPAIAPPQVNTLPLNNSVNDFFKCPKSV